MGIIASLFFKKKILKQKIIKKLYKNCEVVLEKFKSELLTNILIIVSYNKPIIMARIYSLKKFKQATKF